MTDDEITKIWERHDHTRFNLQSVAIAFARELLNASAQQAEPVRRFDLDMDGSMDDLPEGRWVRYEDHCKAIAAPAPASPAEYIKQLEKETSFAKTTLEATREAARSSPAMRKAVKDAMAHARQWISSAQHGDNCFVSRRYEGDPGDGCNCGKDSALEAIDRVDFDESVSPTHKVADARDANVRSEGFRDCIDAIKGCIEFGRQGVMQPPEGHWLAEFWEIGRQISDAARYRFIKREGIVLAGGPWPIAPFGDGCDRHIDAAMSASKEVIGNG